MPTCTVSELFDSRETTLSDSSSVELKFKIIGTDNDLIAVADLDATAPATYNGLLKQELHVIRFGDYDWFGEVRYGPRKKREIGDSSYQFDTSGGSQHITHSRATIATYGGAGAPDCAGAIGWDGTTVHGVDIKVPIYSFSETHYLAAATVSAAYKAALFAATGTVNSATFKGFAAGEVLFEGASGAAKTDDYMWEITYKFAASQNATGLTVGAITGIAKKGWEYMWVRYRDSEDGTVGLIPKAIGVYIEQVYRTSDFSLIGIGTT